MQATLLKTKPMSTTQIKAEITAYLDEVDDSFLKAVHAVLAAYTQKKEADPIIGYNVDGKPMRASEAKVEFKRRLEAVERGEYITLEELKKESETWGKATKS